ncbi:hypothetical protein DFH06DRAFT_566278 [Mycena polygramma]|nr:hypothetical protein DFH06DRAFT_566278 [Mycena polygramma]
MRMLPEATGVGPMETACPCQPGPSISRTVLGKDSRALHVLYELVVPPWPFIIWVAFRTESQNQQNPIQTFLSLLHDTDNRDIFSWDANDEAELHRIVANSGSGVHTLYPPDWTGYMLEIDIQTWGQVRDLTRAASRTHRGADDTKIRLAAVLIKISSTLTTFQDNISGPLDIIFNNFPNATIARIVGEKDLEKDQEYYKARQRALVDFESFESPAFWTSRNLEHFSSVRSETICRAIRHRDFGSSWSPSLPWLHCSLIGTLERVQCMHLALTALHQNLTVYTYSVILGWPDRNRALAAFWEFGHPTFLESLKYYYFHVRVLLSLLKQSFEVSVLDLT